MNSRSVAALLLVFAASAFAAAAPTPWSIPPGRLADIDLRNPRVASAKDLALYWRAVDDLERAAKLVAHGRAAEMPRYYWAWAMDQMGWWSQMGRWLYGSAMPRFDHDLVFCGEPAQGPAKQLFIQAAEDVGNFLQEHFDLPRPKFAIFVRLFTDWQGLPPAVAEPFARHEGLVSVSGLTIPPRFVVVPTVLPARHFWGRDEQLIGPGGKILSLLTLRDIVYHEMVHGFVLGLLAELSEQGRPGPEDDIPQWLHEGLAVYVTEKLKIEPGTKPVSYYRFAAPLHYLEDEWGQETLRDFVHTAVTESFAAAMHEIPMDEARLLQLGDEHMHRPAPIGTVTRSLGYVMAFLLGLLGLALAPAAIGWAARRIVAAFARPDEAMLDLLWARAWYRLGDDPVDEARRFVRAFRRASPQVREAFAWRRCKIYLILRE